MLCGSDVVFVGVVYDVVFEVLFLTLFLQVLFLMLFLRVTGQDSVPLFSERTNPR